jgi:hypothetical protein
VPIGVEPRAPGSPSPPQEAPQEEESETPSKIKDQICKKRFLTPTYLLPLALIIFKVGCSAKHSMRRLKAALTIKRLPKLIAFAMATNLPYQVPRIRFNTDSFVIGVDTYASVTMGNCPDQFEDLKLHSGKEDTEVEGIKGGLEIMGTGTFKFHIEDNDGGVHLIKIPNSKYIPELRICLLLPHH